MTEGKVDVNTANQVALVCNRWEGILDINVKLGDKVKKGQLLFSIEDGDMLAQKASNQSIANYNKELFERRDKLIKTNNISLLDYLTSKVDYEKALLAVRLDDIQIQQSTNYAPFDGTVTKIYRFSGSGNGAGKPVCEITAAE